MKKLHLLQCFDVTDAVKDGIDDFNKLSGFKSVETKEFICHPKKTPAKNVFKMLTLSIIALAVKIIK
jgi:hypothetical protein